MALYPLAHQLGHVLEKSQVTALSFGRRVRTLHDLQQPHRLLAGYERRRNEEVSGRIALARLFARSRHGRNQLGSTLRKQTRQEPAVQHGLLVVGLHQAWIHLDLMGQSHAAFGVYQPNGATRRGQCRYDPL